MVYNMLVILGVLQHLFGLIYLGLPNKSISKPRSQPHIENLFLAAVKVFLQKKSFQKMVWRQIGDGNEALLLMTVSRNIALNVGAHHGAVI